MEINLRGVGSAVVNGASAIASGVASVAVRIATTVKTLFGELATSACALKNSLGFKYSLFAFSYPKAALGLRYAAYGTLAVGILYGLREAAKRLAPRFEAWRAKPADPVATSA